MTDKKELARRIWDGANPDTKAVYVQCVALTNETEWRISDINGSIVGYVSVVCEECQSLLDPPFIGLGFCWDCWDRLHRQPTRVPRCPLIRGFSSLSTLNGC